MMNKIFLALLLCLCLFFGACASKKYSDTLTCKDLTTALKDKIFADEQYSEYLQSDVEHIFSNGKISDYCVLYSSSSDDIGEFGVLCAESAEEARKLLSSVESHIDDIRQSKSEFLRNYMPEELSKLENAKAKQFGRYVVFVLHDSDPSSKIFKEAEGLLKQKD